MLVFKNVRVGDKIWKRDTQELFLVTAKGAYGLFIINLMLPGDPFITFMLSPRDQDSWDADKDITDIETWRKDILDKKKDLIEVYSGTQT